MTQGASFSGGLALAVALASGCADQARPVSSHAVGSAEVIGKRIERVAVSSSAMRSVGYNGHERILAIEFPNGDVYRYFDVPESEYEGLMAAESHGGYFHRHIRDGGYRYERVRRD